MQFLDFDYSEDELGYASWDAMASVTQERLPELCAEISALLHWALEDYPGPQGAPEDGGDWDYELTAHADDDQHSACDLHYDPATQTLVWDRPAPPQAQRLTLTLTLSGNAQFAQLLQERWQI